jgi:Predicted membrane protein (DUF2306)
MNLQTQAALESARQSKNVGTPQTRMRSRRPRWLRVLGWLLVGVSAFYALFALTIAAQTAMALAGLTEPEQTRAAPPLLVAHAVTGAVALLAASVQLGLLTTPPPPRQRRLHRALGITYVITAVLTSVLSGPLIAAFDVDAVAKAAFVGEAGLWLATTVIAYVHIRAHHVQRHREWMIRSYALAAFFITFSLWDPFLAALPLPPASAFAIAVLLGWLVNLAAAEVWIRRTRRPGNRPQPAHAHDLTEHPEPKPPTLATAENVP